jgi:tetratricopeptide (TPR) repeat protein
MPAMPRPDPSNIYRTAPSSAETTEEVRGMPVFLNRSVQRRNGWLTGGVLALALFVIWGIIVLISRRLDLVEQNSLPNVPEGPLTTLPGLNSNDLQRVRAEAREKHPSTGSAPTNQILTLLDVRLPPPEPLGLAQSLSNAQERSASLSMDLGQRPDENSLAFLMTRVARQLYEKGEYAEAAEQLTRALEREPDFTEAGELLAAVHLARKDYALAATAYAELIRRNPLQARYRNNLALAQLRMGEDEPAEKNLRDALRLDAGYGDAKVNLGLLMFKRRDYPTTIRMLNEVRFSYPEHPGVLYALGVSLLERGDYPGARGHLEELNRLLPERSDVYAMVARSHAAESADAMALSWLRMAKERATAGEFLHYLQEPAFEPMRQSAAFQKLLE